MTKTLACIWLSPAERATLEGLVSGRNTPQKLVWRARIVLLSADGIGTMTIVRLVGKSKVTVWRWQERYLAKGIAGLRRDATRPGRKPPLSAEVIERVVHKTLHETPEAATHWSIRKMARAVGLSYTSVQRIWKAHGLKPHLVKTFKLSNDEHFVEKVRDIVGLYLDPPDKALVLSVDEKSQIQALDRTQPGLPIKKGRAGTMTHDYKRHGTTTLFAALDVATGKVIGHCMKRHRHQEWLKFLRRIDAETPKKLDLHLIADNYATHKHPKVKAWLAKHPRFHMHFTPTSASWLSQVERFFGLITSDQIRCGVFKSVAELETAIQEYLEHHNADPKPFVWTASATAILEKVARGRQALESVHYVREQGLRSREVFVPLSHSPGHAQADFGEAMAVIGGALRKIHFLAFDLPHSDGCFVAAYPAETTEAFCDGHNAAFAFFGGVPRSILYDNTKLAVARILGDGKRQRTRVFTELQSHYLFEDRFGRPGKGNDKGKVEGLVGFIRRNFLVPVPRAESFAALNDALAEQCRRRQAARLRGHKETIGERLERDRQVLLPLPPAPYDACDKRPGRASSLSLVRYRSNDYSVPVAYGHREVLIRGYVDEVVISCGAEVIARHRRSYDSEDLIFDPLHYLPLIEQKIGALDQAAPLAGWDLPEAFITLRRLLEARMGKAGKREYVQVLRLLETFRLEEVEGAVGDALRLGAIGFDAVKHLVLCRIERRPPRLNLDVYPYLPRARVAMTSAKSYMSLLSGLGA